MNSVDDTLLRTERVIRALEEDRSILEDTSFMDRLTDLRKQHRETTEYLARLWEQEQARYERPVPQRSCRQFAIHHCPSDWTIHHCPSQRMIYRCPSEPLVHPNPSEDYTVQLRPHEFVVYPSQTYESAARRPAADHSGLPPRMSMPPLHTPQSQKSSAQQPRMDEYLAQQTRVGEHSAQESRRSGYSTQYSHTEEHPTPLQRSKEYPTRQTEGLTPTSTELEDYVLRQHESEKQPVRQVKSATNVMYDSLPYPLSSHSFPPAPPLQNRTQSVPTIDHAAVPVQVPVREYSSGSSHSSEGSSRGSRKSKGSCHSSSRSKHSGAPSGEDETSSHSQEHDQGSSVRSPDKNGKPTSEEEPPPRPSRRHSDSSDKPPRPTEPSVKPRRRSELVTSQLREKTRAAVPISGPTVQDAADVLQLSLKAKAKKREERARTHHQKTPTLEKVEERSEDERTSQIENKIGEEKRLPAPSEEGSKEEISQKNNKQETRHERKQSERGSSRAAKTKISRSKSAVIVREPSIPKSTAIAKRGVVPDPIQDFVPQITVPVPFKLSTRSYFANAKASRRSISLTKINLDVEARIDASSTRYHASMRKAIVNTYSTKFVEEMMTKKKKEEEEEEIRASKTKPFVAKTVPKSTYVPTNPRLNDQAYIEAIRRRLTATLRKHFEQEALSRRSKSMGDISGIARPVPMSTYVAPVLPDYRRGRSTSRRAVELLVEASSPPIIREHTIRSHVSTKVRHLQCLEDQSGDHLVRSPIPDFAKLHAEMEKALQNAPHKPTTTPKPFHLTEPGAHRHRHCKSSSPPRWRARDVRIAKEGVVIRPTHSSIIRMEAIRDSPGSSRQRQEKLEEERHRSEKFWEDRKDDLDLSRLKILSSMGSRTNLDEEIEKKTAEKKRHVVETTRDYEKYLAEMQQRIIDRPLIMEQQSIIAQKQKFNRKYEERMAAVGKTPASRSLLMVTERHDSDVSGATYSVKSKAENGAGEDNYGSEFDSEEELSGSKKRSSSSASSSTSSSSASVSSQSSSSKQSGTASTSHSGSSGSEQHN